MRKKEREELIKAIAEISGGAFQDKSDMDLVLKGINRIRKILGIPELPTMEELGEIRSIKLTELPIGRQDFKAPDIFPDH